MDILFCSSSLASNGMREVDQCKQIADGSCHHGIRGDLCTVHTKGPLIPSIFLPRLIERKGTEQMCR